MDDVERLVDMGDAVAKGAGRVKKPVKSGKISAPEGPKAATMAPKNPEGPEKSTGAHLGRMIALLNPYRGRWILATLALVGGTAVNLALPQPARLAVDDALKAGDSGALDQIALLALGGFVLLGVLVMVRHYLMSWLGNRVVADLRDRAFKHLLTFPPSYFHEQKTGALVSRLTSDIGAIQSSVGSEFSVALRSIVTVLGGIVILLLTSPRLTVAMLLIVPPLAVASVWVGRRIRARAKRMQDLVADANGGLKESLEGIETVQTFTAEAAEAKRYGGQVYAAFTESLKIALLRGGFMGAVQTAAFGSVTVILWLGGQAVIDGEMAAGEVLAFVIYTVMVAGSLAALAGIWGNLQRAMGASSRIFQLLDTVPTIESPDDATVLQTCRGDVAFEDVAFAYASRPDVTVLRGISMVAKPGETIALVGRSGAGKSTLMALLQRFYDPASGRVTIDGHDLRDLELQSLRRAIATVAQDPVLFSGSIRDNMAFGATDPSDATLRAAARDANILAFIESLPQGWDSLVGERGVKLSGGQRQRMAIARAVVADPAILILDEATSHLDTENEALVHAALERLMRGRTTFIIAHRLSTVQSADRICVLDRGRVVETGTHGELMATDSVYRRLAASQWVAGGGGLAQ